MVTVNAEKGEDFFGALSYASAVVGECETVVKAHKPLVLPVVETCLREAPQGPVYFHSTMRGMYFWNYCTFKRY